MTRPVLLAAEDCRIMPLRARHWLPLLCASLLLVGGCLRTSPQPVVVSGVLNGEQVWSGEVLLSGDVTLAPGARLTLLPGTTVYFLPSPGSSGSYTEHPYFAGSELIVQGQLVAVGTPAAPVRFLAEDADAPAGSWGALNFENGARGTFAYCIFRQADSAIHSRDSQVSISESLFEDNLVGIRFHSSAMRIERNLLQGNGVAIRFHFGAPTVTDNMFRSNRVNLFITAAPRDYHFARNFFGAAREYQVVLGEEVPEDVELGGNAWEGLAADNPGACCFDGRTAAYLGKLLFEPVLPTVPEDAGPTWIR